MTVSRTLGTLSPIVYFVNSSGSDRDPAHPAGYIMLAPYTHEYFPTPHGYYREEAGTLAEARRLNDRIVAQSREEWEREYETNYALVAAKKLEVRDRIVERMNRSDTTPYEREFLQHYLLLRDEKAEKYERLWQQRIAYLWALENDCGKRDSASEEFHPDRINVRR